MLEQEFPLSIFRLMLSIQNVKAVEINLFHRTNWNFSWRFDIMVSFQDENLSQTDNHAGLMTGDWAMRVWPHSLIGGWGLGAFSVFWGISWSSLELNEVTILQEAMWCYRSFTFFLWRKFIFAPWIQKPTIFMHNVQTVINVHFCFPLKKQNTGGWTMMHCQFFVNFDLCIFLAYLPNIFAVYFWCTGFSLRFSLDIKLADYINQHIRSLRSGFQENVLW